MKKREAQEGQVEEQTAGGPRYFFFIPVDKTPTAAGSFARLLSPVAGAVPQRSGEPLPVAARPGPRLVFHEADKTHDA